MDYYQFVFEGRDVSVTHPAPGVWGLNDRGGMKRLPHAVGAEILRLAEERTALERHCEELEKRNAELEAVLPKLQEALAALKRGECAICKSEERVRIYRAVLAAMWKASAAWSLETKSEKHAGAAEAFELVIATLDSLCPEMSDSPPCAHEPSGIEDAMGLLNHDCGVEHCWREKCLKCGAWVPWHDFPGRAQESDSPPADRD